jgi:hypothetical protein
MNWFYLIISVIAVIVLILSLAFVGVIMKKSEQATVFPSSASQCPDMWIPDGSNCIFNGVNSGTYAVSTTNSKKFADDTASTTSTTAPYFVTGTTSTNNSIITPSDPRWATGTTSAICSQSKWANINNIQWTGVREYNNC